MGFQTVTDLNAETTISLGGFNKKTKRDNPTSVEGYYLGSRKVPSKKAKTGFCSIYFFQTPKGNIGVWGKTDLDQKMAAVGLGVMVRASFSKMVATQNGEMYKYLVEFDPDNSIEVSALPSGNSDNSGKTDGSENDTISDYADDTADDTGSSYDESAETLVAQQKRVQDLLNKNKNRTTK